MSAAPENHVIIREETNALAGNAIGGRFLLIDAAASADIRKLLDASLLPYASLFSGGDTGLLSEEAPYLLDRAEGFSSADNSNKLMATLREHKAVVGLDADSSLDNLRHHWRKWLTVRLPETGNKVMFRFFDAHILAAFLVTLTAAEARAFFGPVSQFHLSEGASEAIYRLRPDALAVAPMRLAPGEFYQITPVQMKTFEDATGQAFKDDLFRFFRAVFPEQTRRLNDQELHEQLELGIKDAERLGDLSPGAVLSIEAVRILRPDIINDEWIWDQVMEKNPLSDDPIARYAILEGYMTSDFGSLSELEAYDYALDRFWQKDF